ncbi:MAG TPA: hypothetical protein VGI39_07125 [Polyangiaceae bacterium]|jgi:hypothetical protein
MHHSFSRTALPLRSFLLAAGLSTLSACSNRLTTSGSDGGSGDTTGASSGGAGIGTGSGSGSGSTSGDASTDPRASAIASTIANDPSCTALPAFYWEIGDARGALYSGAVGTTYGATSSMAIASASKFVWSAYVVQRFASDLSQMDADAMRMLDGYTSFVYDSCLLTTSVSKCLAAGNNATVDSADIGKFYYDGGDFQNYAVTLGLGDDDSAKLASDIKAQVGTEFYFTYGSPQLAGGIKTTPADYAAFLRKILSGGLALHDHLGENAVCTLPAECPGAASSPSPKAWHYSYAHWVEDDPNGGDGAFSSPGAFGFYPWIDATKTYYGILARYSLDAGAYYQSALCGALIRKAFTTGTAQ